MNDDPGNDSASTDAVLAHALRMRDDALPAAAEQAALDLLIDAVGVGIVGSSTPESRALLTTACTWGDGKEAGVWGTGAQLPGQQAAMVNAHQMHCLEFDAIHEPAVVHPMTVVFPVLAAWAQRATAQGVAVSGRQFLTAVAVGVDVAAGLGEVTTSPLQFFRPATAGCLGSVAALTTATSAPPDRAAAAFGIAYGGLSGTMQPHQEGAQVLALQVGFNARAALASWDLAHAGFRGPRRVLEGTFGYFRLIEAAGEPGRLAARLGTQWEVERTSIKPFPSGRATHGMLDAVMTLQEDHGFGADDVERVEAVVPRMIDTLVGRPISSDLTPGAARLCARYLVAYALHHHDVSLDAYADAALRDPRLLELGWRVNVRVDDNPDPNAFDPQTVRITLRSGVWHEITLDRSLGSPVRPMSAAQRDAKFRTNLGAAGWDGNPERLLDLARGVLDLADVSTLIEAM